MIRAFSNREKPRKLTKLIFDSKGYLRLTFAGGTPGSL